MGRSTAGLWEGGGHLIHFIVFFMWEISLHNCLLYEILPPGSHSPVALLDPPVAYEIQAAEHQLINAER